MNNVKSANIVGKTKLVYFGDFKVVDPSCGDLELSVFPLENIRCGWPFQFNIWSNAVQKILKLVPYANNTSNQHYVTIDSRFFTEKGFLRREGIHIDGNFCVDKNFQGATWSGLTWSGAKLGDSGEIVRKWADPYGIDVPVGEYVSEDLGGIFLASSEVGCRVWEGDFDDVAVGSEGNLENYRDSFYNYFTPTEQGKFSNSKVLKKNRLYFMSSNTPHETLNVEKGSRRTLIRVTLAHDYPNRLVMEQ